MKIGGLDLLRGTCQNGLDLFQGGIISQTGCFQRRHGCFFPILIQHGIYQTVVWSSCTGPLQLFYTDMIRIDAVTLVLCRLRMIQRLPSKPVLMSSGCNSQTLI